MFRKNILLEKSDKLDYLIYAITKNFPKEEIFGITSQLRRSSLSISLNIVEGFARSRDKSYKQFLLIAFGSVKETMYLLDFCHKEDLINESDYEECYGLAEECAKMLWKTIEIIKSKC